MAKYAGLVGYVTQTETKPGIWSAIVTTRKMRGDVLRLSTEFRSDTEIHDDVALQHRISLVADPYAYQHFTQMAYVTYMGQKWKVSSVEVQRPRLILTLGGLWHG